MKRALAIGCLMSVAVVFGSTAEAQLLYKISGKNLKRPSYIVGTMHLAPGSFASDINGMAEAMASVQQVIGEVAQDEMDALQSPEEQAKIMEKMRLPNGLTLKKLLTKEQYGRLNDVMLRTIGMNMKTPAVGMQMYNLTPSALAITLTQTVYMLLVPGYNPADQLDMHFQRQALAEGKKTGGLESAEFQMEMLYSQDSLDKQVTDLMCFLDHFESSVDQSRRLMQAYYSQDIAKIDAVVAEMDTAESDCGSGDEAMDALLNDRNSDWVKKMPKMMKKHPTLFVVGCAHLVGEKGVLRMLRDKGYKLEPTEPTKVVAESSAFRLEVRPKPRYMFEYSQMIMPDDDLKCELVVSASSLARQALEGYLYQKYDSDAQYHKVAEEATANEYSVTIQFKKTPFDYNGLLDTMAARGWVKTDTLTEEPAYALRIADTTLFLGATTPNIHQTGERNYSCHNIKWELRKSLPVVAENTDELWQRRVGQLPTATTIDEAREWLKPLGMDLVPADRNIVRYSVHEKKSPFAQ